ncbi:hypothetical protein MAR_008089 [Mya arenaria]|uniref:Uncharacterized protein n=1 Tax=Mya arenaria TaxID=6604 RepID=A0ABY7DZ17_MYAAR|nr:hypothetical protein MAR_008089 [Mya arenaria]
MSYACLRQINNNKNNYEISQAQVNTLGRLLRCCRKETGSRPPYKSHTQTPSLDTTGTRDIVLYVGTLDKVLAGLQIKQQLKLHGCPTPQNVLLHDQQLLTQFLKSSCNLTNLSICTIVGALPISQHCISRSNVLSRPLSSTQTCDLQQA